MPWERRGERTDEYLQVLRALWCDDPSSFSGTHYTLPPCNFHPKPCRTRTPRSTSAARARPPCAATARVGQGWHTFNRAPADLPGALAHLETLFGDQGRSRSEITVTVCPYFKPLDASITEQYAEAGADAVCGFLFAMSAEDVPAAFDALDPCLERARAC